MASNAKYPSYKKSPVKRKSIRKIQRGSPFDDKSKVRLSTSQISDSPLKNSRIAKKRASPRRSPRLQRDINESLQYRRKPKTKISALYDDSVYDRNSMVMMLVDEKEAQLSEAYEYGNMKTSEKGVYVYYIEQLQLVKEELQTNFSQAAITKATNLLARVNKVPEFQAL